MGCDIKVFFIVHVVAKLNFKSVYSLLPFNALIDEIFISHEQLMNFNCSSKSFHSGSSCPSFERFFVVLSSTTTWSSDENESFPPQQRKKHSTERISPISKFSFLPLGTNEKCTFGFGERRRQWEQLEWIFDTVCKWTLSSREAKPSVIWFLHFFLVNF